METSQETDLSDHQTGETSSLSERHFEEITDTIEIKVSKRLKDGELGQREILRLNENLSSKVDILTGSNLGLCSSNSGMNSRSFIRGKRPRNRRPTRSISTTQLGH